MGQAPGWTTWLVNPAGTLLVAYDNPASPIQFGVASEAVRSARLVCVGAVPGFAMLNHGSVEQWCGDQ